MRTSAIYEAMRMKEIRSKVKGEMDDAKSTVDVGAGDILE